MEHGYGEADSILQTLRGLPIIPLADGRVVALSEERVFFPMGETKTKDKKAQTHTGTFTSVHSASLFDLLNVRIFCVIMLSR